MASDTTRYTNKVFMTGALPLLKTIANDVPELKKKFEGVNAVYQVSAMANAQDKEAIHFIIFQHYLARKLQIFLYIRCDAVAHHLTYNRCHSSDILDIYAFLCIG